MKEYLCKSSLVSKLQAKHDLLKVAVEKGTALTTSVINTTVQHDF